jgi:hypothetical protein
MNLIPGGNGKGCTFYICIPVYEPKDEPRLSFRTAVSNLPFMQQRPKILPFDSHDYSLNLRLPNSFRSAKGNSYRASQAVYETLDSASDGPPRCERVLSLQDHGDVEMGVPVFDGPSLSFNTNARSLKILIVDDSLTNRKIVTKSILAEPELIKFPTIVEANDGDVAVKLVQESINKGEQLYDLILMDAEMSKLNGLDATRKLRGIECNFKGKIVGLTGNSLPEDVDDFRRAGCDIVLVKPLKIKKLLDFLASVGLIT